MAYFNHAFGKAFVAKSVASTAKKTHELAPGEVGFVTDASWSVLTDPTTLTAGNLLHFVQGSFHTKDSIGNNPGHGGYSESVKSKGINPRFISKLWSSDVATSTAATVKVSVGSKCAPCGQSLFLRLDVKGSPALRFLNHNAYAIGDSAGSAALGDVPGICCIDGQEFLDPAVALAKAAAMLLEDAIIKPFVKEKTGGGIVVTVAGTPTTYTIAEILDGTYTPSTDPVADQVTASVEFEGAYVDTKFGNCSFDTRDHYELEPIQLFGSVLDETGNPCNDCGVVETTPGTMAQTSGETVLRDILLTENYMQSPFNQGNPDSARIREIEGSNDILNAIDRTALYKVYYIQHSIPRLNNATSMFDNDQYVYKIYVKSTDAAVIASLDALMGDLATLASNYGNPIAFIDEIDA
ncbi:MAG: hypothetical protein E6R13_08705 [Spirochaetes bacterium]|nr:MAG: hypothetical protein E6R13_08705 [Spirochaetota bacterium]